MRPLQISTHQGYAVFDRNFSKLTAGQTEVPFGVVLVQPHRLQVEIEREADGRVIAAVPELPGVMVYGASIEDATRRVRSLALRVLADLVEHGDAAGDVSSVMFSAATAP